MQCKNIVVYINFSIIFIVKRYLIISLTVSMNLIERTILKKNCSNEEGK